jgi:hypothetical protein
MSQGNGANEMKSIINTFEKFNNFFVNLVANYLYMYATNYIKTIMISFIKVKKG